MLRLVKSGSEVIDFNPSLEIGHAEKSIAEIVRTDAMSRAISSVIAIPRQDTLLSEARNS
jgi:hypothetical protein